MATAPVPSRPFVVSGNYTRISIQEALGLPHPTSGGKWGTGYTRHDGQFYVFANVGTPGRTGHDYANCWLPDGRLEWEAKGPTNAGQPLMIALTAPEAVVHVFWREGDRDAFTYAGRAVATEVEKRSPVRLKWQFASANETTRDDSRDASMQKAATSAAAAVLEPKANGAKGQGFASSKVLRDAIESHAMAAAEAHFKALGYSIKNTSTTCPYDFVGTKGASTIFVEVKGTTTAGAQVILTRNEVEHARAHREEMVLFVLAEIQVDDRPSGPVAFGGKQVVYWPWDLDGGELEPISYMHWLPASPSRR